ncbi:MAG: HTTM domain-containing protein, partial [Paracoccus sp. (in: a-proteobacteria)]|nr:HTTM domain-containing protein [Paracoccus sp. (in: a-proteobacteria)]
PDVEIRADIWKSLNGRPYQQFIDPDTDLVRAENHPLRRNDWVLPLKVPVARIGGQGRPRADRPCHASNCDRKTRPFN